MKPLDDNHQEALALLDQALRTLLTAARAGRSTTEQDLLVLHSLVRQAIVALKDKPSD